MKIFLAALDSGDCATFIERGLIENGFWSYFYARKRKTPNNLLLAKGKVKLNIIDSGAHTFLVGNSKTANADRFMESYIQWLKQWYEYYDYFVELDIGEIVGQKKVLEWRKVLEEENLIAKCITVYHPECMTWDDYIATLETSKSRYVAVGGDRPKQRARLPYKKIIKECIDRGIRIHGFAMTKEDAIEKYPFYSVDSSSWKSGYRYGRAYVRAKGVKYLNLSRGQTRPTGQAYENEKARLIRLNIPHAMKFFAKNSTEKTEAYGLTAIQAMQRMEAYYTDLWRARGIDWDEILR